MQHKRPDYRPPVVQLASSSGSSGLSAPNEVAQWSSEQATAVDKD